MSLTRCDGKHYTCGTEALRWSFRFCVAVITLACIFEIRMSELTVRSGKNYLRVAQVELILIPVWEET
jgi:hypothetical protein